MVKLTFLGGVNEIGGNKILIQDQKTHIILDFGLSFAKGKEYYTGFLTARNVAGAADDLELGILPKIKGLYSKQMLKFTDLKYEEPKYDAIFLSHAHMDHYAHLLRFWLRYLLLDRIPSEIYKTIYSCWSLQINGGGVTSQNKLISELTSSNLYAECTHCGEEFKLSDAILFDGLGAFPKIAAEKREALFTELKKRIDELKKRKISVIGAEKKAIEVGIGKIIEKIIPAYKEFKIPLSDCRPLFEPIDLIVFNGMTKMNIDSVTFLEIKTGSSRLSQHEKMVRDAIDGKKLLCKVV